MSKLNFSYILSILLIISACHQNKVGQRNTFDMKEYLRQMNDTITWPKAFWRSDKGIEMLEKKMPETVIGLQAKAKKLSTDEGYLIKLYYYPHLLLQIGRAEESIAQFDELIELLEYVAKTDSSEMASKIKSKIPEVKKNLAIAYLRWAEEVNCLEYHNMQSCIFPIAPEAYHQFEDGSQKAISSYTDILKDDPENYQARWLLNIAYMTLGKHPDEVPEEFLIDFDIFDTPYNSTPFLDIASKVSINALSLAGGSITEDFNNDGLLDVFVSSFRLDHNVTFYLNNGKGFENHTKAAGLEGITGGINLTHADYNNDGFMDVYVIRGGWISVLGNYGNQPNSLLRNNGDNTFTDVTYDAGLLEINPTLSAIWGDYNNDGFVDLFVGSESIGAANKKISHLYHNNGDGTFKDVSKEVGLHFIRDVKGVSWGDYNNDGNLDLYVSCYSQKNMLFKNSVNKDGGNKFVDVAEIAGVSNAIYTFPTFFFDYDNDGFLDIYAGGYPDAYDSLEIFETVQVATEYLGIEPAKYIPFLFHNNKDGTFTNVTTEMNLERNAVVMGINYGDIDNDGWLDIYNGTGGAHFQLLFPNLLFRNNRGIDFQDVTTGSRTGHLQKTHGISFADIDNDGDQDIYANIGGFFQGDFYPNVLFENPGNTNKWITLKFKGKTSNSFGFDNRIRLVVNSTRIGRRLIYSTISTGGSFGSSTIQQEIGLGDAISLDTIEVYWPASKTKQIFTDVAVNNVYHVVEFSDTLINIDLPEVKFTNDVNKQMTNH